MQDIQDKDRTASYQKLAHELIGIGEIQQDTSKFLTRLKYKGGADAPVGFLKRLHQSSNEKPFVFNALEQSVLQELFSSNTPYKASRRHFLFAGVLAATSLGLNFGADRIEKNKASAPGIITSKNSVASTSMNQWAYVTAFGSFAELILGMNAYFAASDKQGQDAAKKDLVLDHVRSKLDQLLQGVAQKQVEDSATKAPMER